jgi:hypothetical protein
MGKRWEEKMEAYPLWVIQWGNRSREYPSCEPCAATVRAASAVFAAAAVGTFGGARGARLTLTGTATVEAARARARVRYCILLWDEGERS